MAGYLLERLQEYRPYFEVLNAVSSLLAIVTWLIAIPILIVAWRRSREIRLRIFGIEATFKRGIEAATAIVAATAKRSDITGQESPELRVSAVARTIERAVAPTGMSALSNKSVLWVDDKPSFNKYEIRALSALGIKVTSCIDTEPALRELAARKFDLIISDMGRLSSEMAGYVLLETLRKQGNTTPFIIYSGSKLPAHVQEALRRGAQGATNDPQELLELVIESLSHVGGKV